MKKSILAVAILGTSLLTSCGMLGGQGAGNGSLLGTTNKQQTTTNNTGSALGSVLGSVLGGGNGSSLLGSILGAFGASTNANTLIGTWTYSQPSIQFESSNLLAKAGGGVASQTIINKIAPYYEKVGLKPGVAKITLNQDKTCNIALSSKNISGTYVYDQAAGTLTVTSTVGVKLFTAYVSVSMNQLSLTMDTTNLLGMVQNIGSKSSNTTLSSISSVSKMFDGMKTGFLFTK